PNYRLLVSKPSGHCPSLWAAIRDGRYVYSCRSAFVLTPAFRLGFVMTAEWALALKGRYWG
ncbi:MAG TPA: hypothetical protein VJ440_00480, partial [Candidatus Brocadiaceae bacterium]|nr:hypothetical protein [Candidatus Brocadiaceae bacterium]